ncbi:EF-hand domain-containing protein [Stenotrophomonas sp. 24(2023)]|uniref:EF-hand domain-containing protein n=1 Tax=Stenotrophomonas sp. 24(2023) TaxID=3068324 RepID=UPI0027DF7DB9|nr:EF-hand domain-containing protein [Stenotrophomonas sp. 24(2023)]WMJ67610.1 EF-hand domain-containing protein [Stenotrophomonas sp. 24(2023)]
MTIRNRKPLIALVIAAGSLLALPAMAQSAQQQAAQAQSQAAQAQQAAAQAGQAATQATDSAAAASAQANGGGGGQTWASIDTDGNGTISKAEAQVNAGLAQVFDQADTNKDGQLTPDEYKAFVQSQQGAAGAAQGN